MARNTKISELFYELEKREQSETRELPGDDSDIYSQIFNDVAVIDEVTKNALLLNTVDGEFVCELEITPQLAQVCRSGDHLGLILGYRNEKWRVIALCLVASIPTPDTLVHPKLKKPKLDNVPEGAYVVTTRMPSFYQ